MLTVILCFTSLATQQTITCTSVAFDSWLAFSKVSGIETLHLLSEVDPNPPFRPIENATTMRNVIGLAIDRANSLYYFTDIQIGNIQSVSFQGTDFKVIVESK
jgi:hypothetical protein